MVRKRQFGPLAEFVAILVSVLALWQIVSQFGKLGVGYMKVSPSLGISNGFQVSLRSKLEAVAGGIALISSLGNLGPAVAPSLTGYISATTGNSLYSTYFIVAAYLLSGLLLLIIVKAADPNEALNEPAVETGLAS